MRIGDIVETVAVPTVMQLETLTRLRERLDVDLLATPEPAHRSEPSVSGPQAELRHLLCDYVLDEPNGNGNGGNGNGQGSTATALRTALEGVCIADDEDAPAATGAGLLIDGVHGAGKTHFLIILALLLEYPLARGIFAEAHPEFGGVLEALDHQQPLLVVPVSLDEHRGRNDLLEDIVCDATELEFARPKYGVHLPLSGQSHALHLIDEYIATRYRHELDAYVRQEGASDAAPVEFEAPSQASLPFSDGEWARLRRADPVRALQTARQFLREINYPLDFRQSRVQRLDRLTETLASSGFRGVVWLVDELGLFLRSAEAKALSSDCGFLQFLGQRTHTGPMWFVGTMRRSVETMNDLSPHAVQQVRERYKTGLSLSSSNVRQVLRQRVIRRRDPRTFDRTIAALHERWKERFSGLSFTPEQLADAYPLHPMAMDCLEAAAGRFLSRARSAIDFVQARVAGDRDRALAGIMDQHVSTLVTPDVIFDHFSGQIAQGALPVGPYVGEVNEYFMRNIATLLPGQAGLGMRTVKTLLMLRATNQEVSVKRLAECVMLPEPATDESPHAAMRAVLEQLSRRTPYVRLRKRDDDLDDIYFIEVPPRASDGIRHRVATARSVLDDDDPRVVEHALQACRTSIFPISNFRHTKVVELEWRNTRRHAAVLQANISALTPDQIADAMHRLADPGTRESCQVFIGVPFRPEEQIKHWQAICKDLPSDRWRSALVAWIPRPVEDGELLRLKQYAATRMVHDAGASRRAGRPGSSASPSEDADSEAPDSRDIEALMRGLYAEGTLVTAARARAEAPSPSLPAVKDNWGSLVRYVCGVAFEGVFPRFADVMPAARLAGQGQIARLIADVIFGDLAAESVTPRLRALVRTHMVPMGLAAEHDGHIVLSTSDSPVTSEAYRLVTRRDTSQRDTQGRPFALDHLVQLLAKSELGLPRAMSRLTVAALVRVGYLQPLNASQRPIRLHSRAAPGSQGEAAEASTTGGDDPLGSVAHVARAALLAHQEWQQAAGIARGLLGLPLAPPDWPVQQALWEQLVGAKADWDVRLEDLRGRLEDLCKALGHGREQWQDSYEAIQTAGAIFESVDPSLAAADGLRHLIAGCAELSKRSALLGARPLAPALAQVVARIEAVEKFLASHAQPITLMHDYLSRAEIPERPSTQAAANRQRLLGLIAGGEGLVGRSTMVERLWRSFHAAFTRAYVAWHDRCRNAAQFQRYQQLRSMPPYRVVRQLSKLGLPTQVSLKSIDETLDAERAKQCANDSVAEDLARAPVCPRCELALGASLELTSPDDVAELIGQCLTEHIAAFRAPHIRNALVRYAESCPTSDLGNRIRALTELLPDAAPERLFVMLSNEVIGHARRAIGGRRVHTRSLDALRGQFTGEILSKADVAEKLRQWLDARDELSEDELFHLE